MLLEFGPVLEAVLARYEVLCIGELRSVFQAQSGELLDSLGLILPEPIEQRLRLLL